MYPGLHFVQFVFDEHFIQLLEQFSHLLFDEFKACPILQLVQLVEVLSQVKQLESHKEQELLDNKK